jgi:hypothetical protein
MALTQEAVHGIASRFEAKAEFLLYPHKAERRGIPIRLRGICLMMPATMGVPVKRRRAMLASNPIKE